ncbi:hypothetical protein V8J88_06215 [Massilia sp. W12]|uniref:hypothetical protein n=1 Tax=Massilia sp. W12 TaxID=3126507 RepID=UPI0030D42350
MKKNAFRPAARAIILAGSICSAPYLAQAQTSPPPAAPAPPPCAAPEWRAFDFWLGEWNVYLPDGKLAGQNSITREYGGCVLHERYSTPRAYAGESLNTWDAQRKVWHQTWVDNSGTLLLLEGGMQGKSMVMQGMGTDNAGKPQMQRITWTPNADGSVRQLWENQTAPDKWGVVFDGLYKRKS